MNILIFGASITYGALDTEGGWVARLRKFVDEKSIKNDEYYREIYNLGIPGNTTDDLLERFDKEANTRIGESEFNTEIRIIFCVGVNDSAFILKEQKHRISLNQFETNLNKLIEYSKKYTSKIAFVGLSPIDDSKTYPVPWMPSRGYKTEYVNQYNKVVQKIAKENSALFIDLFNEFINRDYKNLLPDGLHPNNEGHQIIADIVKEELLREGWI